MRNRVRATINGTLNPSGRYLWFWGLEVANKNSGSQATGGVSSTCTGCRFINLVIHDHSSNGLEMWSEGPDQEAYGNIIYNNGFYGLSSTHSAHGIYAQNTSGTQKIIDNLLLNQFGFGIHVYGEGTGLNNYTIDGNTAVNNGIGCEDRISVTGDHLTIDVLRYPGSTSARAILMARLPPFFRSSPCSRPCSEFCS